MGMYCVPCVQRFRRRLRLSQLDRGSAGQVVVFTAIGLIVLVGFLACATDVGLLLAARRGEQNAVDAAALAVAQAMFNGVSSQATLQNLADYYTQQNGFSEFPSLSYPDPDTVKVSLTHQAPKYFVGVVYPGPWTVVSTATAAIKPAPKQYALLALDQQQAAIQLGGSGSINVAGGGAMSNGSISCNGGGSLTADQTVDAHAGEPPPGNCTVKGAQGQNPSAPLAQDPFASLAPPPVPNLPSVGATAACTQSGTIYTCPSGNNSSKNSISVSGSTGQINFGQGDHQFVNTTISLGSGSTMNVNPGTYYFQGSNITISGAINLSGAGNCVFYVSGGSITFRGGSNYANSAPPIIFYFSSTTQVYFGGNQGTTYIPPGLYYLDGSSPQFGNSTVAGNNVFFYLGSGVAWQSNGSSNYQFTAPSSNIFQSWYSSYPSHLLIYGQRGSSQTVSINGNSGILLDGIVYLPSGTLNLLGNFSGTWANGQFIVQDLYYSGNSTGTIRYQPYVPIQVRSVYLIE